MITSKNAKKRWRKQLAELKRAPPKAKPVADRVVPARRMKVAEWTFRRFWDQ